ncbi:MAG: beta-propeller fold lactonase family protein [Fimbriimonas sp.]|nr:beta-propeller fold lactonase family protein [Fimbriimonas sp.]
MKKTAWIAVTALIPGLSLAGTNHYVYTLLNQTTGNAVQTYVQTSAGKLKLVGQTKTGGKGTGALLGSQGALALSQSGRYLFAVNGGDNTVSLFSVNNGTLTLLDLENSGGASPASVTESGGLVYVLNQGTANTAGGIQGFANFLGELIPIPRAAAAVSAPGVVPVEVKFTPDGDGLVVAEKLTNKLDTFKLDDRGLPSEVRYQPSNGATPFGFDFDKKGRLFVTEAVGGSANASTVSSYSLDSSLDLTTLTRTEATNQTAACWDVVSPNGHFLYTGNAGSGSVSGFSINSQGKIQLLKSNGVSGMTGGHTLDTAMSSDGDYLYVLSAGNQQITTFRVTANGSLVQVDTATGLPAGTTGLVAH